MKTIKNFMISILIGLTVGVITVIGQKYLPINLNFLANSGAIWLIPTYLLSYYLKQDKLSSILVSIICLISCVLGYYLFESILNNHSFFISMYMIIWLVCALIGGTIFGLGAYYSNNKENILNQFSQNLLPAVLFSEGVNKLIHLNNYNHMIPAVITVTILGILLYLIINRKNIVKGKNIITFVILSVLGILFYEIIYIICS
ncbi:MAG: hypothetical protein HFJ38_06615 [Bacilli bacterium]|mgnify:CR=1 FL=1|nr:hypothetical protein [Bacilli bacterium]